MPNRSLRVRARAPTRTVASVPPPPPTRPARAWRGCARGALEVARDAADGRRTLVRMGPGTADGAARHASVAVDGALGDALDITDPQALAELVAALESVLGHLCEGRASER